MSLFGTITNATSALQTAQIGLQTVGNNLANADTEGYIRQRLIQTTPQPYRQGNLLLGHGVRPSAIVQTIDQQLAQRMWNAGSDLSAAERRRSVLADIESLFNDLDGGGLSADLSALEGALHDWSVQPADRSLQSFVLASAEQVASKLNRLHSDAQGYRAEINGRVSDSIEQVNALAKQIAELNTRIMTLEGGRALGSDAASLRDQRYQAIEQLGQLVKVRVREQENGAVNLFVGGDYLVAGDHARSVGLQRRGESLAEVVAFQDNGAAVDLVGGEIRALIEGRDSLVGGVVDHLDAVAQTLIVQFNRIHSQGQGAIGFDSATSYHPFPSDGALPSPDGVLEIQSGFFEIMLVDSDGEHLSRHEISIRGAHSDDPSRLQDVIDQISAIDGLSASRRADGRLEIVADAPEVQLTFGEDTSQFLTAAGLNSFFDGSSAQSIELASHLRLQPERLAISQGGIGRDTETLGRLAALIENGLDDGTAASDGNDTARSVRDRYSQVLGQLAKTAANQQAELEGLSQYHATLSSQHLAVTGVNIDEEAVRMMGYQRTFQASSRVIAVANEMLEILVTL